LLVFARAASKSAFDSDGSTSSHTRRLVDDQPVSVM
jgi:hypothetical protein